MVKTAAQFQREIEQEAEKRLTPKQKDILSRLGVGQSRAVSGGGGGGTFTTSPAKPKKPKTPAQLTGEQAAAIREETAGLSPAEAQAKQAKEVLALRKAAGTFGEDIGPVVEEKRLRGFVKEQQEKAKEKRPRLEKEIRPFEPGRRLPGSVIEPITEAPRFRLTAGEATSMAFRDVGRQIKEFFTGRESPDLKDPSRFFKDVGPTKREIEIPASQKIFAPQKRTIITEETFEPSAVLTPKGITFGEKAIQEEVVRGIPKEVVGRPKEAQSVFVAQRLAEGIGTRFSERVGKGEITAQEAKQEAEEEFERKIGKEVGRVTGTQEILRRKGLGDLDVTSGESARSAVLSTARIGAVAAASATPTGQVILGSTLIGAAGPLSVQAGEQNDLVKLGKAGLFAAGGTLALSSVLGVQGSIFRDIDRLELDELAKKKLIIKGEEIGKGQDVTLLKLTGTRVTPSAKQQVKAIVPVFRTGQKGDKILFSVTGARGQAQTEIVKSGLRGIVPIDKATARSIQKLSIFGKGKAGSATLLRKAGDVELPSKFTVARGEGGIIFKSTDKIKRFEFGGLAREEKKAFFTIGGRAVKERVSPRFLVRLEDTNTGQVAERFLLRRQLIIKPTEISKVKKLLPSDITITKIPKDTRIPFDLTGGPGRDIRNVALQRFKQVTVTDKALRESGVAFGRAVLPKIKPLAITKPVVTTKAIQVTGGGAIQAASLRKTEVSRQVIRLSPAIKSTQRIRTTARLLSPQKSKQVARQRAKQVAKISVSIRQPQAQRLGQRQLLRLKQKQVQKQSFAPKFNIPVPITPPPITPTISVGLGGIKIPGLSKKRVRQTSSLSSKELKAGDIAIQQGFTAKALGLKPIKIKKTDIPKIKSVQIGIRRGVVLK